MILQEHDRYRFMPHVFSGDRYGGGSIQDIDMQKISATLKSDESTSTYTRPDTTIPNPTNPAFWIKNQRSLFVSRTRPGTLRRKTINCCRSATFSASSRLFDLNGEAKTARTKQSSANIVH
jgi:hypothetical protein